MVYYNVLSSNGFFTTQHARYADITSAEAHAEQLRGQGIDAYVAAWRSLA